MPSNVVDDRIVKVEFDNEGFEDGISESLDSIGKFEKSLDDLEKTNFGSGISESFGNIQDSINDTDFSPMSDALSNVGHGFSVLEEIAVGALREIGTKVADLGLQMASSLTIDPIATGFQKYTASSKDIKAIMNQAGMDIDEVTEKLEALTWYSDATSYNYSAMVSALKSFSAQGIDIEDSIPMIMGLGNSLSYAGLAAEEASGAFDIYSKAIGRGYMDLRQWQRLNTMGASTVDLKEKYMEAAVAAGTLTKAADGTYKTMSGLEVSVSNFDTTLGDQKGKWLTTEVMMSVLGDTYGSYTNELYEFSKAEENTGKSVVQLMSEYDAQSDSLNMYSRQTFLAAQEARTLAEAINAVADAASSGWKKVFENIFGNAEESTDLWTDFSELVYNVFMGPLEGLSKITTMWKQFGGRTNLIQGFYNLVGSMTTFIDPIKAGFGSVFEIFGSGLLDRLLKLSMQFKEWTWNLQLNNEEQNKLQLISLKVARALDGIISTVKTILGYIKETLKALSPILSIFGTLIKSIITVGNAIRNAFKGIDIVESTVTVSDAIESLGKHVRKLVEFINRYIGKATDKIVGFIQAFKEKGGIDKLAKWVNDFREAFSRLIKGDGNRIADTLEKIKNGFVKVKESLGTGIDKSVEFLSGAFAKLKTATANVIEPLTNVYGAIKDGLGKYLGPVVEDLTGFIDKFKEAGKALVDGLTGGFSEKVSWFIKDVKDFAQKIIDTAKDVLGIQSPSKKFIEIGKMIIEGLIKGIKDGVKRVVAAVTGVTEEVEKEQEEVAPKTFMELVEKVINDVAEHISTLSHIIFGAVGKLVEDVVTDLGGLVTKFFTVGANFIKALADGIGTSSDTVITSIAKNVVKISNSIKKNGGDIFKAGKELIESFLGGIEFKQPTLSGKFAEILTMFFNFVSESVIGAMEAGFNFVASLAEGITNALPVLLKAIEGLIHELSTFMQGPVKDDLLSLISSIGEIILAWTLASIPIIIRNIGKSASEFVQNSSGLVKIFGDGISGILKGLNMSGINSNIAAGIKSTFDALSYSIGNLTKTSPAYIIKAFGVAILEMAAAIYVLSKIDAEKIKPPLVTLAECLGGLLAAVGVIGVTASFGKTNAMAQGINALAASFSSIAIGVAGFGLAAKLLENVEPKDMEKAISILKYLGTAVGIMAVVAAIASAGDLQNFGKSLGMITSAFSRIAVSVAVFALATSKLKEITPDELQHSLYVIKTLGVIVTVFSILGATTDTVGSNTLKIASSMIIIAAALAAFAGAAALLTGADLNGALGALAILSACVAILAVIAFVLEDNASSIASMSASMIIISAALYAFSFAISALSETVSLKSLAQTLGALTLLIAGLTGFGLLAPILEKGTNVISKFAGALLKIGLVIGIVAVSLTLMSTLTEAGVLACLAAFDLLLTGIVALRGNIKNLLIMLLEVILEQIRDSWKSIKDTFEFLIPDFIEALKKWSKLIREWIRGDIVELFKDIGFLLETLIGELIAALFKGIGDGIVDGINGMIERIRDGAIRIAETTESAAEAIDLMFDKVIENIIKKVTNGLIRIAEAIADSVGEIFDAIVNALNKIADKIEEDGPKIRAALDRIKAAWKAAFTSAVTTDSDEIGETAVDSLGSGITKFAWKLASVGKTLWNKIEGAFNKNAGVSTAGTDAGEKLASDVVNSFDEEADINSPSKKMEKRGLYMDEGVAGGMAEGSSIVEKEARNLVKVTDGVLSEGFKFPYTDFKPFPKEDFVQVGRDLLANLKEGFMQTGAFPTPEFTKPVKYGLKKGITEAIKESAKEDAGALKDLFTGIKNVFTNSDEDLVITPVLDLSNIEEGAGQIQDLIGGAADGLAIEAFTGIADSDFASQLGTTVNFTQNNYSPKELSRIDIYRQTKNQLSQRFSTAKGVL